MAIVSDLLTVSLHYIRGATVLCRKVCTNLPEIRQGMGMCTERIPVVSAHQSIMSGDLGSCQALLDELSQAKLDMRSRWDNIVCTSLPAISR